MGIRRRYSREFKLRIIQDLETKRLSEVSREHDITCSTISGWRKEYESNPKGAFSGHGNTWKESAKLVQQERLIGRLYMENDLLKMAYESLKQQQLSSREKKPR